MTNKPIIRDIVVVAQVEMDDATPAGRGQFAAGVWAAVYKHLNLAGYSVESLDVVFEGALLTLKDGKVIALDAEFNNVPLKGIGGE